MGQFGLAARRFGRHRRGGAAVEFALVGLTYFFVLVFVIQAGVFYLRVTVLDYATEQAARLIMIDQAPNNAGTFTNAPATAAALQTLIQADSFGVLNLSSIAVAVQMAPPVTGTTRAAGTGFQAIPPSAATFGTTYQFLPGSCTINYTTVTTGGNTVYTLNSNAGCTTGTCTTAKFSSLPGSGEVNGGTVTTTTVGSTVTSVYSSATFSCSAGNDIVVQAKYTDNTLSSLISGLLGTVTSTVAFQVDPTTT